MDSFAQFLELLHSGEQGLVEVRYLKGGSRDWIAWPAPAATLGWTPERIPAGQEAYWGVSLRREKTGGKKANCVPTALVWSDVDLVDHPDITGGQSKAGLLEASAEELAGYKQALLELIQHRAEAAGLPIRVVVDSGHGLQVYLRRQAASDIADTERYNKALRQLLDGDKAATDASRVLRIPGAENRKNAARPLPVRVVYQAPDAWVDDAALEALTPVSTPQPPVQPLPPRREASSGPAGANRQHAYAQAALRREADEVAAAQPGTRNDRLNQAAFKLGTLVGAGELDETEAADELRYAAKAAGLDDSEIESTLRSGLTAGKARPRDLNQVQWHAPPTAGRGTIGSHPEGRGLGQPKAGRGQGEDKPTLAEYRDMVLASFMERGLIFRHHQLWRNWWRYENGVYVEVPDEVMAQTVDLTLQAQGHTLKDSQVIDSGTTWRREVNLGGAARLATLHFDS